MPIYKPALDRVNAAQLTGPSLAILFEVLGQKMQESGALTVEIKLGYINENTPADQMPKTGELIPEIILRLSAL